MSHSSAEIPTGHDSYWLEIWDHLSLGQKRSQCIFPIVFRVQYLWSSAEFFRVRTVTRSFVIICGRHSYTRKSKNSSDKLGMHGR